MAANPDELVVGVAVRITTHLYGPTFYHRVGSISALRESDLPYEITLRGSSAIRRPSGGKLYLTADDLEIIHPKQKRKKSCQHKKNPYFLQLSRH